MITFSESLFATLRELNENNHKEWFDKNKARIDAERKNFELFLDEIISQLREMDKTIGFQSAKSCMYRMYRDTRFSKDKTPYKTHIAGFIACGGNKNHGMPGYYIHLEDTGSCAGAGVYMPEPDNLKKIRSEIYYNIQEFKEIISGKEYRKLFDGFWNADKLKKAPQGFSQDFPDIELLKHKNFATVHNFSNKEVLDKSFLENVLHVLHTSVPLNQFFYRAITE